MGGPQNLGFTRENPMKMDDLRVPPFMETHENPQIASTTDYTNQPLDFGESLSSDKPYGLPGKLPGFFGQFTMELESWMQQIETGWHPNLSTGVPSSGSR